MPTTNTSSENDELDKKLVSFGNFILARREADVNAGKGFRAYVDDTDVSSWRTSIQSLDTQDGVNDRPDE